MAGGQSGLSFVGEPMVFASGTTFVITILLQLQLGCIGGPGPTPIDENTEKCEEAYAYANDGDPETVNNTEILGTQDCIVHIQNVKRDAAQERAEDLEVSTP